LIVFKREAFFNGSALSFLFLLDLVSDLEDVSLLCLEKDIGISSSSSQSLKKYD
jgi:hypothetical protein